MVGLFGQGLASVLAEDSFGVGVGQVLPLKRGSGVRLGVHLIQLVVLVFPDHLHSNLPIHISNRFRQVFIGTNRWHTTFKLWISSIALTLSSKWVRRGIFQWLQHSLRFPVI